MSRFDACLLDYGNTVVEFDRYQAAWILERFARVLTERFERPTAVWTLGAAKTHVISEPHRGDPPQYRELHPHEEMRLFLRRVFGDDEDFSDEMVEECNRVLQDLFVESIRLQPSSREFLNRLRQRLSVGLVSNYPCGQAIRRSLERVGILDLFDPIVVSGDVGYVKPHPQPFLTALEELRLPPDRVLFVGDRWDMDMMGAGQLGMKTCQHIGHTSDLDLRERYRRYRPDFVIERLEDLDYVLF